MDKERIPPAPPGIEEIEVVDPETVQPESPE